MAVLRALEAQGLLMREGALLLEAGSSADDPLSKWSDVRQRLFTVPCPPVSPSAMSAAVRFWPLALLTSLVPGLVLLRSALGPLPGVVRDSLAAHPLPELILIVLVVVIGYKVLHEVGHAIALAGATGAPVDVGLRLRWGIPSPYTDAAQLVTVPSRRTRIGVLLAGAAAEIVAWWLLVVVAVFGRSHLTGPTLFVGLAVPVTSVLVNLALPFIRNDGYYVLEELFRIRSLAEKGRRSAYSTFFGIDMGRAPASDPWWLPWYGLLGMSLFSFVPIVACGWIGSRFEMAEVGLAFGALLVVGQRVLSVRADRRKDGSTLSDELPEPPPARPTRPEG